MNALDKYFEGLEKRVAELEAKIDRVVDRLQIDGHPLDRIKIVDGKLQPDGTGTNGLCPNCKEPISTDCACFRNKCIKCGEPVGNITFSHCDACFASEEKKWKPNCVNTELLFKKCVDLQNRCNKYCYSPYHHNYNVEAQRFWDKFIPNIINLITTECGIELTEEAENFLSKIKALREGG